MLALNSSRPLFRNNPRLRRAVNFALDRRELLTAPGGPVVNRLTDQYVPPGVPGFRDTPIYPLEERDLQTALRLARGHLRHGKAVLRTAGVAPFAVQAAQLAKQQLAEIGLEVEVDPVPLHYATAEYLGQLTAAGAGWDLALVVWAPNIPDAYAYLNLLLEAQSLGGETLTRVRSRLASAALARAARLPEGRARNLAYAEVDAMIARDVAPAAPLSVISEATLVSERVGCIVLRPVLDLAVACLEE